MLVHVNFNVDINGDDFADCYDKANTVLASIKYADDIHLTGLNMNESLGLVGQTACIAPPMPPENPIETDENIKTPEDEVDDIPF